MCSQNLQSKRFQLAKTNRLRHRAQFSKFFEQPEVFPMGLCTVFRIPNQCGHFRMGMTLKFKAGSILRNKIKRQVRESLRTSADRLGSYDYNVVVGSRGKLDYRFAERLRDRLVGRLDQELKKPSALPKVQ